MPFEPAEIACMAAKHAERAAEELKITAPDLQRLGVIDHIVDEARGVRVIGGQRHDRLAVLAAVAGVFDEAPPDIV